MPRRNKSDSRRIQEMLRRWSPLWRVCSTATRPTEVYRRRWKEDHPVDFPYQQNAEIVVYLLNLKLKTSPTLILRLRLLRIHSIKAANTVSNISIDERQSPITAPYFRPACPWWQGAGLQGSLWIVVIGFAYWWWCPGFGHCGSYTETAPRWTRQRASVAEFIGRQLCNRQRAASCFYHASGQRWHDRQSCRMPVVVHADWPTRAN